MSGSSPLCRLRSLTLDGTGGAGCLSPLLRCACCCWTGSLSRSLSRSGSSTTSDLLIAARSAARDGLGCNLRLRPSVCFVGLVGVANDDSLGGDLDSSKSEEALPLVGLLAEDVAKDFGGDDES